MLSNTQIIKEIKEQYNTIASDWDSSRYAPSELKMKQIKKLKNGEKLLDLGCGNGLIVPAVMKKNVKYIGVDIASALIKIARKKYPEVDFYVGDATKKLKFKNNSFDKVFSFAVMHHIPSEKLRLKFLQEIYRVLKSGGEAVIINWNLLNDWPRKRFGIEEQIKKPNINLGKNDFLVGWTRTPGKNVQRFIHSFTADELKDLSIQAGFTKIKVGNFTRVGKPEKNGEELVLTLVK
ncbi:MAG: hypothetical protein US58_C0027G0003 [Candidatus Magasanikbacteria bacterium GW2011_GWA2_37_8]|uniref:Methyltransferase type 11 domain-containing protein n=1 Tax=Candidatus Magasanikbacteria bacterium GW2011_GWA2_37_8 TaxID=1619036 RepID=A0A0G0HCB3_9BACT|nr:MAG: hypothetical protein US58_C0027G0003 [Candidatus Magasanikbacteria bacterium GW2011_GWA2_37_8]